MAFADFYRGRKVLVTGHTGFKGSWLALWLARLGAEVTGYALAPDTEPSLFEAAGVAGRVRHELGDVRDHARLGALFAEVRPEVVFHLAAQPLVRRSYGEPKLTFDTNVGGTVNALEAIRATDSVRAAVIITTDKCYENLETLEPYRETDRLGGHDPYSASKAGAELAVAAYRRSFFAPGASGRPLGLASTRAGNVIGGGDWAADRIVPDAVRAVTAGRPLEVRSPDAVRPWQHVLEPLGGYLALGCRLVEDAPRYGGAWNFGPAREGVATVAQLIAPFLAALGRGEWRDVSAAQAGAPHEAQLLTLSCDKAAADLAWTPVLSLGETIERTGAWYRRFLFEGADAAALCADEIDDYVARARRRGDWWAR